MANLKDIIDYNELKKLIDNRYINVQKHPTEDIYLYNYSKSCQLNKIWNDITCMCRGLIVDKDLNIISRPFVKFFNYEEITDKSIIPDLPFEVYEKLDGSLGIMYWIGDTPYLCTRGSFSSDQALHGTKILHENYSQYFSQLDKSKTYLFEIIWNEDHHCISYGDLDDIFLIGVIDTETGVEDDIYNWQHIFKCTKRYDGVTDYLKIRELFSGENREGFVVKFSNNFRIKMKYESYFKIHFLRCMLTPKTVFAFVSENKLDEARETLKELDEENKIYFEKIVSDFQNKYNEIETNCKNYIENLKSKYGENYNTDNKDIIFEIQKEKYACVLFKMFRNMKYDQIIWNLIKKYIKDME